jgi:hypothetical protein
MNIDKHGLESRNFMNGRKTERLKFAGSFFYPGPSAYSGVAATRLYAVSIRGYFIFFVS